MQLCPRPRDRTSPNLRKAERFLCHNNAPIGQGLTSAGQKRLNCTPVQRFTVRSSAVSFSSSINVLTAGDDHEFQHGCHELTLRPDELRAVQAFLFAGPSRRAVINSFGGEDKATLRDNPLLAFACFAEQPMTKAHNRAARIRQSVGKSRKHDRLSAIYHELFCASDQVRRRWPGNSRIIGGRKLNTVRLLMSSASCLRALRRKIGKRTRPEFRLWVFIVMLGQAVG